MAEDSGDPNSAHPPPIVLRGGSATGEQIPEPLKPYWDARYELFERFDEGIEVDLDALFEAKPERTALEIADAIVSRRVLDAFCGAGGAAIGLARRGKLVTALDRFAPKLRMAANNASIYGVADRIAFQQVNTVDFLARSAWGCDDAIYFDPPWGGPQYIDKLQFGFDDFIYAERHRFHLGAFIAANPQLEIAVAVPRNFAFAEAQALSRPMRVIDHDVPGRNRSHTILFASI